MADVNTVPLNEAVEGLVNWRSGGVGFGAADIRRIGPEPRPGEEPRIITWTTDVPELVGINNDVTLSKLRRMNEEQIEAIELAHREIERVANVKFKREDGNPRKAQIRYMQGRTGDGSSFALSMGPMRHVVIDERMTGFDYGERGYGFVLHETLHTLGLNHPGGKGRHPRYTGGSTAMHYEDDPIRQGIGAYDVAALIRLYGASKNPHGVQYGLKDLQETTALYTPGTASIIMGAGHTGNLTVNLANAGQFFGRRINGAVNGANVSAGVAPGIALSNVQLAGSNVKLNVTTTSGTQASGGESTDIFNVEGGNTTLTGNGGLDIFRFSPKSKRNNVITDFNPGEDRIEFVGLENSSVELQQRENFLFAGKNRSGTEMVIKNGNVVVSTAFLEGAGAEAVRAHLQTYLPVPAKNNVKIGIDTSNPSYVNPPPETEPATGNDSGMWTAIGAGGLGLIALLIGSVSGMGIVSTILIALAAAAIGGFGGNMLSHSSIASGTPAGAPAGGTAMKPAQDSGTQSKPLGVIDSSIVAPLANLAYTDVSGTSGPLISNVTINGSSGGTSSGRIV